MITMDKPRSAWFSDSVLRSTRYFITLACFGYLIIVMWLPRITHAEHFSIRDYGISDGLPHNRVNCIHQDPKGYLWFGTWEGLSRFDGYRFVNYGTSEGLENSLINDIAEDRDGHLWGIRWLSDLATATARRRRCS